ncbi:MAG TPA: hypothetical protein VFQ44_05350 [Streptosporangiaceae bacterium]|nr:hypothetical protein [Streptosporangiaceae bacterium]
MGIAVSFDFEAAGSANKARHYLVGHSPTASGRADDKEYQIARIGAVGKPHPHERAPAGNLTRTTRPPAAPWDSAPVARPLARSR